MSAIWESETIKKSEQPGGVWPASGAVVASEVFTAAPLSTGLRAVLIYENMLPDGNVVSVGYTLRAVVEEEIAEGVFIPVATQFDEINNNATKGKQIIHLDTAPVFDQGIPEGLEMGAGGIVLQINRTQGNVPDKYRVSIVRKVTDASKPDLEELTISGWVKEIAPPTPA